MGQVGLRMKRQKHQTFGVGWTDSERQREHIMVEEEFEESMSQGSFTFHSLSTRQPNNSEKAIS